MARFHPSARYAIAVALTALAVGVRLSLAPAWGLNLPYITLFPAIMASAWLGGLGPGLLCTVLSALAAQYFWVEPAGSWAIVNPSELVGLGAFVAVGGLMSVMNEAWRRGLLREDAARRAAETVGGQLRVALDAGRMGTWEYTIDSGRVQWSLGLEAIHGRAPGTFPGTFDAFREEIHPADREAVLQAVARAVEERRDYHAEYRIVRPDGSVRWVEGRGRLFLDRAGQPERMVGLCLDVTERKVADDRFRLAVEAAPAAMLLVDRRGTVVLANALAEELLDYRREEILGQPVEQFVPPRYRARHPGHRESFFRDPHQRIMGPGRDLHVLRRDGTEVPVEIGLSPLATEEGHFVLAAISDITGRKETERTRAELLAREQAARADLERANRLKDEFLAVLSHELRTPLSAVLGYTQVLQMGSLSEAGTRHVVEAIRRNADAQARLVDSLLDLSRILAGKLELETEPLDLAEVVEAAVEVIRPSAATKGIAVEVELAAGAVGLVGDRGRLQQVFWNLLANAVKFTPRGGTVTVSLFRRGSVGEVRVADTGAGMSPEFLPYAFDRFRQATGPHDRSVAGLGLGLALVREIVEAHGGTVAAGSMGLGLGSTFTVALPGTLATVPAPGAPAVSAVTAESLTGLDILVVDDDHDARTLLVLLLEARGAAVRTSSTVREALDAIEAHPPDVLLSDLRMPDESGYALIRRVREREAGSGAARLLCIAVTAYARGVDRQQALEAGFDGHVVKPVDPDRLSETITRAVQPRSVDRGRGT